MRATYASAAWHLHALSGASGRCTMVDALWEAAFARDAKGDLIDPLLATDLLDDMLILGLSAGRVDLAVTALEPALNRPRLDSSVAATPRRRFAVLRAPSANAAFERHLTDVLRALASRAPTLVGDALAGDGPLRAVLRRNLSLSVDSAAPDFSISMNIDRILVHDAVRPVAGAVLADLLVAPSFRRFVSNTLERIAAALAVDDASRVG